jgi:hypothetical protein
LEVKRFQNRLQFLSDQNSHRQRIAAPNSPGNQPSNRPTSKRTNKEFKRFKSIVKMVADAFVNPSKFQYFNAMNFILILSPVYLPFDAVEFALQSDKSLFEIPNLGLLDIPATIVDCTGRIVLWYLPGLLPNEIHVRNSRIIFDISHIFSTIG